MFDVDPVANAFIGDAASEDGPIDALDLDAGDDAFSKFIADVELAASISNLTGNLTGYAHVARLAEQTQDIDAQFSKLSPPPVKRATGSLAKSADDLDIEIIADPERLEKNWTRRRAVREWMRDALSKGETVAGLVAYAARTDPAYARELEAIGRELEAA